MLGSHLIATIKVQRQDLLSDEKLLRNVAVSFCKETSLNVVNEHFHIFKDPKAITYCFILSQSHLILHTWPEHAMLSLDLFTCAKIMDSKQYLDSLLKLTSGKLIAHEIISV